MKISIKILVALLLFSVAAYSADNFEFKTLVAKGDVNVKRSNKKDWEKVKSGDKLFSEDQIKVDNGAYLGLLHASGAALELKQSGNYSIAKLASQAGAKKSNVTKKFTNYLIDELSASNDVTGGNHRDNMKTLGAVERAMSTGSTTSIVAGLPGNSYYIDNSAVFSWIATTSNNFKFTIKDGDNNVIFTQDLTTNTIKVDFDALKIPFGQCYFWSVNDGTNSTEDNCIYRMGNEEASPIMTEISNMDTELSEAGALGELMKANYFESNNLMSKAAESYQKALSLSPEVEEFVTAYENFKSRIIK